MSESSESLLLHAENDCQWRSRLPSIFERPPSRKLLSKKMRECFTLRSFLTETSVLQPTFPAFIYNRERPDFRVCLGPEEVGVEVTQITNGALERVRNYLDEKAESRDSSNPDLFNFEDPVFEGASLAKRSARSRLSDRDLSEAVKWRPTSPGYQGFESETRIAGEVMTAWKLKKLDFERQEFHKTTRNILLIYYNGNDAGSGQRGADFIQQQISQARNPDEQEAWLHIYGTWVALTN